MRQTKNRQTNITNGHGVPGEHSPRETETVQISQYQPATPTVVHRPTPAFAVPQSRFFVASVEVFIYRRIFSFCNFKRFFLIDVIRPNVTQQISTATQQGRIAASSGHQIEILSNANPAVGRRSNVVKEVEKLKRNREERRLRQAELKEEKEALMNLDPGNPNWEFLAMIREYRSNLEFRPLKENDSIEDHQITVCVRKRPLNKKGESFLYSVYFSIYERV